MTEINPELWMQSWDKHVRNDLEYPTEGLGVLYTRAMTKYPEKTACWMMDREISFKELLDYVRKFCTFLQQNGIVKGDVVAINLYNCPQYLIAHYGTLLAGAVASDLSPLLSENFHSLPRFIEH